MTDKNPIKLLVGLGNPGSQYDKTRHNAGFWLLDEMARSAGETFRTESRFSGDICKVNWANRPLWLLKPMTFMNRSGLSVKQLASFYKIDVENILVAHDEMDIPVGDVKLKQGGGHGGHNGLRDIHNQMTKEYWRLRIGIGHPGDRNKVTGYVLSAPNRDDEISILRGVDDIVRVMDDIVVGDMQKVMQQLHSK